MGNGGSTPSTGHSPVRNDGSSPHGLGTKYLTIQEAADVLGAEKFASIRRMAMNFAINDFLDIGVFSLMLQMKLDRMPRQLCDCLYRAFGVDTNTKITVNEFLGGLAVVSLMSAVDVDPSHMTVIMRLLYNVYDHNMRGEIKKEETINILRLAYNEVVDHVETIAVVDRFFRIVAERRLSSSSSSYGSPAPRAPSSTQSNISLQDDCTMSSKEFESILVTQSLSAEGTPRRMSIIRSRSKVETSGIIAEISDAQLQQSRLTIKVLGSWVASSLGMLMEPPLCPYTEALERRYSSNLEHASCIAKFGLTTRECETLWTMYASQCFTSTASPVARLSHLRYYSAMPRSVGMTLGTWVAWTVPSSSRIAFSARSLIEAVFIAKIRGGSRKEWRFYDFVEFVAIFGTQGHDSMAQYLIEAFVGDMSTQVRKESMRRFKCLLFLLSIPAADPSYSSRDWRAFNEDEPTLYPELTDFLSKIESTTPSSISAARLKSGMVDTIVLHSTTRTTLLGSTPGEPLLPGLRDLSLVCNALLGIPPSRPVREKEVIVELSLRYQVAAPQDRHSPYGPVGTEWCVISSEWYNAWRLYVGSNAGTSMSNDARGSADQQVNTVKGSTAKAVKESKVVNSAPGQISNSAITIDRTVSQSTPSNRLYSLEALFSVSDIPITDIAINRKLTHKYNNVELIPGLSLRDVEVVPPAAYNALMFWYGGGPAVVRRVVQADLELYPLSVTLAVCDRRGIISDYETILVLSRSLTVGKLVEYFSSITDLPCRLWRLSKDSQDGQRRKDDFNMLTNHSEELGLALSESLDVLLLEVNYTRVSWPMDSADSITTTVVTSSTTSEDSLSPHKVISSSTSSSSLEATPSSTADANKLRASVPCSSTSRSLTVREIRKNAAASSSSSSSSSSSAVKSFASTFRGGVKNKIPGITGLDNLGNTCYLNASLQALLHTEPLIDYFLSLRYLKDVNIDGKFSLSGRLAYIFGLLSREVWTTTKQALNPREFIRELTSLFEQFAGHEQHDAQEFITVVLDGLHEDLNLVTEKPYIESPDSDGRPDNVLADIWWRNHLTRENSIVQSLFTGQFKSVMTCRDCGFSSARYEPFSILAVPIPDTSIQDSGYSSMQSEVVITVHIMPRYLTDDKTATADPKYPLHKCCVKVTRSCTLQDVLKIILSYEIPSVDEMKSYSFARVKRNSTSDLYRVSFLYPDDQPIAEMKEVDLHTVWLFELTQQSSKDEQRINILFSQRHLRHVPMPQDRSQSSTAKQHVYNMTMFGAPFLESIVPQITVKALYDLVASRMEPYLLKHSAESFHNLAVAKERYLHSRTSTSAFNSTFSSSIRSPTTPSPPSPPISSTTTPSLTSSTLPIGNDSAVSGPALNSYGFTIRCTNVGGSSCAICRPWLVPKGGKRTGLAAIEQGISPVICQGCALFSAAGDGSEVITLTEGDILSVDWNYFTFLEAVDPSASCHIMLHSSVNDLCDTSSSAFSLGTCLSKFMEEEHMEDFTCPKCRGEPRSSAADLDSEIPFKSLGNTKSMAIWRLPPILIIQLKRFKFDRYARRKLNHRIAFPLTRLNMSSYLTSSRLEDLVAVDEGVYRSKASTASIATSPDDVNAMYDLYAIVHHSGIMGSGHYVATVKESDGRWYCYNDESIELIKESELEAGPSSAYLLFYMRKDIQGVELEALLESHLMSFGVRQDSGSEKREAVRTGSVNNAAADSVSTPSKQQQATTTMRSAPCTSEVQLEELSRRKLAAARRGETESQGGRGRYGGRTSIGNKGDDNNGACVLS